MSKKKPGLQKRAEAAADRHYNSLRRTAHPASEKGQQIERQAVAYELGYIAGYRAAQRRGESR